LTHLKEKLLTVTVVAVTSVAKTPVGAQV
jgi:hypothetical protein